MQRCAFCSGVVLAMQLVEVPSGTPYVVLECLSCGRTPGEQPRIAPPDLSHFVREKYQGRGRPRKERTAS